MQTDPNHLPFLSDLTLLRSDPKMSANIIANPKRRRLTPERVKFVANKTDMLSLFECCQCLEPIAPPILQCRKGHLFCKSCRQSLPKPAKCPNCYVNIDKEIRCSSLEKLASFSRLHFTCKYVLNGCPIATVLKNKRIHEQSCPFRPYSCSDFYPDHHNWQCCWSGNSGQLVQHMMAAHLLPIYVLTDSLDIVCNYRVDLRECLWESLIVYGDKIFLFKLAKKSDAFNAVLVLIGEQTASDQFRYKLEVDIDGSNGTELLCQSKPISIRDKKLKSILFGSDGLHFSSEMVKHCVQRGFIAIKVRITMA